MHLKPQISKIKKIQANIVNIKSDNDHVLEKKKKFITYLVHRMARLYLEFMTELMYDFDRSYGKAVITGASETGVSPYEAADVVNKIIEPMTHYF